MPVGAHIRVTSSGIVELHGLFNRTEGAVRRFGNAGNAASRKLRTAFSGLKNPLSGVIGLAAKAGIGLGAFELARNVVDVDEAITRMAIAAGKGANEIGEIRRQFLAVSKEASVSTGDITAGAAKFIEITGDYDRAMASIGGIAKVSTATGAEVEDVAATAAELGQKLKIPGDQMERIFSILASQGKAGAFELKQMATEFPSLLSGLASFNQEGEGAIRTFGAFLQIARQGKGSAAETATAVEALMAQLRNVATRGKLIKLGIKLEGQGPVEILKQLVEKTKGNIVKLQQTLGGRREALEAITPLANKFRETGGFAELEKLQNIDDLEVLTRDFGTYMTSAAGQMRKAKIAAENLAIEKLTDSFRELAAKVSGPLISGMQWASDNLVTIAVGYASLKALPGFIGAIASASSGVSGALGGLGAAAGSAQAALGAFAVGYGIGTAIDQYFGISDKLSNAAVEDEKRWAKKRVAEEFTPEVRKQTVLTQARQLASLSSRGAESFEITAGKRVALTPENIAMKLSQTAQAQGMSKEEYATLVPAIKEAISQVQLKVEVKPSGGIDKLEVQQSRGAL